MRSRRGLRGATLAMLVHFGGCFVLLLMRGVCAVRAACAGCGAGALGVAAWVLTQCPLPFVTVRASRGGLPCAPLSMLVCFGGCFVSWRMRGICAVHAVCAGRGAGTLGVAD